MVTGFGGSHKHLRRLTQTSWPAWAVSQQSRLDQTWSWAFRAWTRSTCPKSSPARFASADSRRESRCSGFPSVSVSRVPRSEPAPGSYVQDAVFALILKTCLSALVLAFYGLPARELDKPREICVLQIARVLVRLSFGKTPATKWYCGERRTEQRESGCADFEKRLPVGEPACCAFLMKTTMTRCAWPRGSVMSLERTKVAVIHCCPCGRPLSNASTEYRLSRR